MACIRSYVRSYAASVRRYTDEECRNAYETVTTKKSWDGAQPQRSLKRLVIQEYHKRGLGT